MSDSNSTGDPDADAALGISTPAAAIQAPQMTGDPDADAVIAAPQSEGSSGSQWMQGNVYRPLELAGRHIIEGATAIPVMAGNAGIAIGDIANRYLPGYRPQNQLQPINVPSLLTKAGFPQDTGWFEKGIGAIESGITGAALLPAPVTGGPPSPLTGAQQAALGQGREVGMQASPGQQAGSVPMQQLEAKLESQPWTSGPAAALRTGNQTALNRAWASAIGENSDTVDSSVLERAQDRLGAVFDSVKDQTPRTIDPKAFDTSMAKLDSDYRGLLPGNAKVTDHPLVQDLIDLRNNGSATGEQLGNLSSKLSRAANNQMTSPSGDRQLGMALYQVKDGVDDLVEQGLSPAEATEYNTARSQYRAMMQLTSRTGNLNPSTGNVSGVNMASYLQSKDRPGFLMGGNQSSAYKATRFAQAFKPAVGNSGTATRQLGISDMWQLPMGVPLNLASRYYYKFGLPSLSGATGGALQAAPGVAAVTQEP